MIEPRWFVAIPIPDEIRTVLKENMDVMKKPYAFQKWVHPQDLHITLKFLGAASATARRQIVQSLTALTSSFPAFDLRLKGWGTFGRPASPGILWAGVGGDLQRLFALQAGVEHAALQAEFEREKRPYSPHITLARRYNGKTKFPSDPWTAESANPDASLHAWQVQKVVLYRSHLHQNPMYEEIEYFPLVYGNKG
ncbi:MULTISPECIES: RNA 2',3'-cyclic phosphodiesterase [Paenibacillus]|uniref:RNA 2',3'-cyclic phosphodiesterase n=1 Tax=Paenibacillus naphthalenovorans TaxID=162209 RepID=A0A0U2M162_9BACL|nr:MULTISPECIES: RNA 2',3'-cyclic phosphodiesterase [Paenibacillus]ALS20736.1 2'-5' RNA ligase [Paenibacillus naphthalenovorans]GCL70766.1 RNA 2',3'-cyclic phosphodiesterase [Paenibacillus naphthalenovorans]SDI23813.1 2'-5' RNA ligase [Paenibacillus naphthalenovorans]